ncbi:MAG: P-loop NTPase [Lachnospiraceae bacterium]
MQDQAQQLRNVIKQRNIKTTVTPKVKAKARVLTITSGKGGVGKSNLAVNLAIQLRKSGKRVIIFDADIGLANVEVMFGTIPKYNLGDLVYREKAFRNCDGRPDGSRFRFWWFRNCRTKSPDSGTDRPSGG